jgi:hypothetical protein
MNPDRNEEPLDAACAETRDRLPLHVGGDLLALEARSVDAHLSTCGPCRLEAQRLADARQGFFEVLHRTAAEELAREGLWKGIAERLAAQQHGKRRGPARSEPADAARARAQDRRSQAQPAPDVTAAGAARRAESPRAEGVGADFDATELAVSGAGTIHEYGYPGRRALRLLAGATVVAAAALLVAVVFSKAPRQDGRGDSVADVVPVQDGAGTGAPAAEPPSGLVRIGVDDDERRLLLQPRDAGQPALGAGREALVGHQPTWR